MSRHLELALLCGGMATAAVLSTVSGEILHHDAGFHHSRVVAAVIPLGTAAWGTTAGGFRERRAPVAAHIACAVLIFVAFWLGATAQALLPSQEFLAAKAAKLIPTMLLGSVLLRKSYRWLDWAAAGLAICGLIMVQPQHSHSSADGVSVSGAMVVIASLFFDAAYANVQEQVVRAHGAQPSELAACGMGFAAVLFFAVTIPDADSRAGLWRVVTEAKVAGGLALFAAANVLGAVCGLRMVASFGASAAGFSSIIAKTTALAALLILFPRDVPVKTLVGAGLVFMAVVLASSGKPAPPPGSPVASDGTSECGSPVSSPVASPTASPLTGPVTLSLPLASSPAIHPLAEGTAAADAGPGSSLSSGASAQPQDVAFALDDGVAAAAGGTPAASSAADSTGATDRTAASTDVKQKPPRAPAVRNAPPSPSRRKAGGPAGLLHLAPGLSLSRRPSMDDVLQHIGLPRPKRATLDLLSPLAAGAVGPSHLGAGAAAGGRFRFGGSGAGGGASAASSGRRHMSMINLSELAASSQRGAGGAARSSSAQSTALADGDASGSSQRTASSQPGPPGSRSPGRVGSRTLPPPLQSTTEPAPAIAAALGVAQTAARSASGVAVNPPSPALRMRHAASSSALL